MSYDNRTRPDLYKNFWDKQSIKKICQNIGCSGICPNMCQNYPENCDIIKKLRARKEKGEWDAVKRYSVLVGTIKVDS
jgi:hypothetical protein